MRKYGLEHFRIELIEETDKPEEREIYWIEQKRSFKTGYNATMGGDGRKYLDYDLIVATYNQLQHLGNTARILGIDETTVRKVLTINNVSIRTSQDVLKEKCSVPVHMFDLNDNYIQTFPSSHEAARYMVENGLTGCKHSTIRQHISEVCKGRRKTAAKFKWKYEDK